jgi:glycosyltransferase involved in cell wall biosynthesis
MTQLTIAIPTFNRRNELTETVGRLLPQLTDSCVLLIVDNASAMDVEIFLQPLLANWPDVRVQFHRNRYNLGMCGNFMRCFELCETEWLWMLGDDDPPCHDAISTILSSINTNPDCDFHNFVCPTLRIENKLTPRISSHKTTGVEEFVFDLDHFSSIQFISLSVYRSPVFVPHFALGIDYAYSLNNFVALILMGLGRDRRAHFSNEALIPNHGSINKAWSRINLVLGSCTLLDLPLSDKVRGCLARKIGGTFLRLKTLATILFDEIQNKTRTPDQAQFIFNQICTRSYYYEKSFALKLQILIYKILFYFPYISTPLRKTPLINKILFNEKNNTTILR